MTYAVEYLTQDKLLLYWPNIEAQLKTVPHVWEQEWTLETLQMMALDGMLQVWACGPGNDIHMLVFTRIQTWASGRKFLSVFLSFGNDLENCGPLFDAAFEHFANTSGCYCIKVVGREGWERWGKSLGYRRTSVTLTKQLYGERRQ